MLPSKLLPCSLLPRFLPLFNAWIPYQQAGLKAKKKDQHSAKSTFNFTFKWLFRDLRVEKHRKQYKMKKEEETENNNLKKNERDKKR